MVRLKGKTSNKGKKHQLRFNSKMVRLKAPLIMLLILAVSMFQFQNGSIKRENLIDSTFIALKFQFQNGSIKRTKSKIIQMLKV